MAQTSGFFNANIVDDTPDRAYNAEDFSRYFASFIGNGVFAHNLEELRVVTSQSNMTVTVQPGRAFCNGFWFNSDENVDMLLTSNPNYQQRWDAVIVSFNFLERTAQIEILPGTETLSYSDGKSYIYNSLLRDMSSVYQLCLAIVRVPSNASTYILTDADIYDVRAEEYCGWVTGLVEQLDTSSIVTQLQADFEAWFEDIKGQLSEDAAGHLQNQINSIKTGGTSVGRSKGLMEANKDRNLKVWIGTTAEYNSLEEKEENVLYILSDDNTPENIQSAIQALQVELTKINTTSLTTPRVYSSKYTLSAYPDTVALQVLKQGESTVVPFEACHVGIAGLPLALRGNGYSITDGSMNFLKKPGETIDQTYGIQFYEYMAARLYNGQITLGNPSIATRLLGTDVISNKISIKGVTYPTNTYADNNPKIRFNSEKENQNISLTFTDFNEIGGTASLTLNGNQGGEYFIAPYIQATSGFIGTIISPSDERIKKYILPLDNRYLELVKKLQPVEFKYKDSSDDRTHAGFIAQRVQEAIQDAGLEDKNVAAFLDLSKDGKKYALAYTEFIPMLLAYCNDLQRQINELKEAMSDGLS